MIDPYHCNHSTTKQASNVKLRLHGYGCVLHWSPGERCAQDNALRARQEQESTCEHEEPGRLHDDSWTVGARTRRRYQAPTRVAPAYSCWPAVELLTDDLGGLEIVDLAECLSIGELLGDYWRAFSDCPISDVLERHEGPLALALGRLSEEQAEELAEELAEEEPGSDAIVALLSSIVIVARLSALRDDLDLEPLAEWFDEWIWSGDVQVLDVLAEDYETCDLLLDVASVLDLPLGQELPGAYWPDDFRDAFGSTFGRYDGQVSVSGSSLEIPISEDAKALLFGANKRPDVHDGSWYGAFELTWRVALQAHEGLREIADLDVESYELGVLDLFHDVPQIVERSLGLDVQALENHPRHGEYHAVLGDLLVTREQLLSWLLFEELFGSCDVYCSPYEGEALCIERHEAREIVNALQRLGFQEIDEDDLDDPGVLLNVLANVLRLARDQELECGQVGGYLGGWLDDLADELEGGCDDE